MQNNPTLSNFTFTCRVCNIDYEQLYKLSILILASICSFLGNLLVILIVYRNITLRTCTNYFIVNMSVSDILSPLFVLMDYKFLSGRVSRGWLLPFFISVSFGVSMLTLVVVTVLRFSAVVFPLRARVQNKRKRLLVLLLTWVMPIGMSSRYFIYPHNFSEERQRYFLITNTQQLRIWSIVDLLLFLVLPLLIMMVLYPLIIIRLRKRKVPGNANFSEAVHRRAAQNFSLTIMFIVITVAFLLSWGPYMIVFILFIWNEHWVLINIDPCIFAYSLFVTLSTPVVFHAINPVLYFVFCSSFRQGFKNIFNSCCSKTKPGAPAEKLELNNIPQPLQNN